MNCTGISDSKIRLTSTNIKKAEQFCEGVNANVIVYVPSAVRDVFTSTSNVTVIECDV